MREAARVSISFKEMCGIYAEVLPSTRASDIDNAELKLALSRRGPDQMACCHVDINLSVIRCLSSILHMRGHEPTVQPLNSPEYILQWNGEVFGGLEVLWGGFMLLLFLFCRFPRVPVIHRWSWVS